MGAEILDDVNLDKAFAVSFDARDFVTANWYGGEIRNRLDSVGAFIGGIFGQHRFPLFEARSNFSQETAAKESVTEEVKKTVEKFKSTAKPVFIILAIGAVAYFLINKK